MKSEEFATAQIARTLLSVVCCLLSVVSCKDGEVTSKYCNLPARLTIDNVIQAPVLYTACESMGEYCTIKSDGQRFLFTNAASKTDPINITAMNGYSGYYLGLSGLIVGKLTIPEMGEEYPSVVCYDLACSNCYQDHGITKPLKLQTGGYAKCDKCSRTYNLNDCGNVTSASSSGRPLFRYRVSYRNYVLLVYNG